MLSKIDRYFEEVICTICLAVVVGSVLLQVILRYFFSTAAAWAASAAAESITAARAAIIAKPAATAAKPILLTKIVAWGKRITAAAKWIEAIFTEPVALVPSAAAPSIVTHNLLRTL